MWEKLRATVLSTDCDRSNLENVEYFCCLGTMITNGSSCTQGTKSCTVVVKAAMNKQPFSVQTVIDQTWRMWNTSAVWVP